MLFGPDAMDWEAQGHDWPNRAASRFVQVRGMRWHVQRMGEGPQLLLVHGAGASTHSWRDLLPLLAPRFDVIAVDLPGHGFTVAPSLSELSLPGMAAALGALLLQLDVAPDIVVGHSAGAAILARLCLDSRLAPRRLVSLNGALLPFAGVAGAMFPGLAKLLFVNPLAPRMFAWAARDAARVARLLKDTGSAIDARGMELYARLLRAPSHVAGALAMMANWNLGGLAAGLPQLGPCLVLVVGTADGTVPPAQSIAIAGDCPKARLVKFEGLGHLAHEERPDLVAELILELAREDGLVALDEPAPKAAGAARRA